MLHESSSVLTFEDGEEDVDITGAGTGEEITGTDVEVAGFASKAQTERNSVTDAITNSEFDLAVIFTSR